MGAEQFTNVIVGESAKGCYDILVKEAEEEYGKGPYNGTISTCSFGRCTLKFDKYLKGNEKAAYKHIDDRDGGDKGIATYIDLGIVEYEVLTIKKEKREYDAKYKMKYVVCVKDGWKYMQTEYSYEKIKDAEEKAIELTLMQPNDKFRVTKEYVLVEGDNVNFDLVVESKIYTKKPTLKLKANQRILEKHKYIFYGWASC